MACRSPACASASRASSGRSKTCSAQSATEADAACGVVDLVFEAPAGESVLPTRVVPHAAGRSTSYYDALAASTVGWHEQEHDPWPWLRYFAGVMLGGAYRRFEERVGAFGGRGSKRDALNRFLASAVSDEFAIADLRRAAPDTSDAMIKAVLKEWRDGGLVASQGRGRNASYRRLRRPGDT